MLFRDLPRPRRRPARWQAAEAHGADPERVVIFHSLSKRSNLPGLRSGFVAGGPESMARMKQLRSYAGAPLPLPLQAVAERAWNDETHVEETARSTRRNTASPTR
jgi:N-succinyldiaminopimelate aminotransferase